MKRDPFQFGQWLVRPSTNCIEQDGETRQMEPRAMDVLLALCEANGSVLSADQLLTACWGTDAYGDNPVHKTIAQLRRLLGDAANAPVYIETIRKRGYRTLAGVTLGSADTIVLPPWKDGTPFRGLQAFDQNHAPVFFGRGDATRELAEAAKAQAEAGYALQLLLGPSGSGKTSIVLAGLFPALSLAGSSDGLALLDTTTFDLAEQGEHGLFVTLAGAMLDMQWDGQPLFPGVSVIGLAHALIHDIDDVIRQMAAVLEQAGTHLAAPAPSRKPRLLRFGIFIDRLEALFNAGQVTEADRLAFLQAISRLARSGVALMVLGCRNDFYAHVAAHPELMEGKSKGAHFDLAPPSAAEIAQIIRMPAAMAGLTYGIDPDTHARLDDVLCAGATSSPDALPLLQYCLQELHRLRSDDGELTFATFRELGGLEGAISQRAEQVVAGFSEKQTASLSRVMSLVVVLSANEESITSRHAPWAALVNDEERQVVSALVESRLFVSDLKGDTPSFGIAHEALLRRWPRLVEWAEAHRAALRVRGWLAQQAARWAAEGRPDDLLLSQGKRLTEARVLQTEGVFALSDSEAALIATSIKRVQLRTRLRTLVFAAIVILALTASVMGLRATAAKRQAEQQRAEAEGLMGFMLGDFVDKLRPLGKLDLLDSVSLKGLEYLKRPQDEEVSPTALTQRAKALQVIGEVRRARGDTKGALEALSAADDILQQQNHAYPQDTEVLKTLGTTAFWLGQISMDQTDLPKAQEYWQAYLDTSNRLNGIEPANVEWWIEQSYAHTNLGSLALQHNDLNLATREFNQSVALKERALSKGETTTLLADLANTYSFLASTKQYQGELDTASRLYDKELQIILHLRDIAPVEVLWVKKQVFALRMRADIRVAWGLDQQALSDYREARALFQDLLTRDPGQSRLAKRNRQSGTRGAAHRRAYAQCQGYFRGSRDCRNNAARPGRICPKNSEWARLEATSHLYLASAMLAKGKTDEAKHEDRLAMDQLDKLNITGKNSMLPRLKLVDTLLLSSDINRAQSDPEAAKTACRRAAGLLEATGPSTWDYRVLDPWVRINTCLANEEAAAIAEKRLEKIGYNDLVYRRFISTHHERKEQ
jgi:DNA-binding winged helix-turn-helix (wHTH) protein/tetratricopeptide (TPR) repeat protein